MASPRAKYLSNESTGNRKKSLDGDVVEIVGALAEARLQWQHRPGSTPSLPVLPPRVSLTTELYVDKQLALSAKSARTYLKLVRITTKIPYYPQDDYG